MMKIHIFIWVIGVLRLTREATITRNFLLHNDMSEQCRRRVVSSIFLGRQVAISNAEVMHFSRLDLPYSCSIGVRTESGSNIILVILSKSEKTITRACTEGHDQLLVYELGETFGGYWGALPESLFQQETQNPSTYYTLKTTKALPEAVDTGRTDYDTLAEDTVSMPTPQEEMESNYVVMEVPLVNVSGNLELGETEVTLGEENELFDLIYDVTPKNGVLYETSLMPLVQFSIWKQEKQENGLDQTEPCYQLDYNIQGFTPDSRLIFRTNNHKRKHSNRPFLWTRRRNIKKKNKKLFDVNNWTSRIHPQKEYITELITPTTSINRKLMDLTNVKNNTDTSLLNSYLKLINVNNITTCPENMDDEALDLLKRISKMKHNASVYLESNLSKYNNISSIAIKKTIKTKEITNDAARNFLTALPFSTKDLLQSANSLNNSNLINDMSTAKFDKEMSTDITLNTTNNNPQELTIVTTLSNNMEHEKILGFQSTSVLYSQPDNFDKLITVNERKSESGSLVDHESWENIVQVAPVMADLLNVTKPLIPDNTTFITKNEMKNSPSIRPEDKINRKKRYIQALSIDRDRPRQVTTKEDVPIKERGIDKFDGHHLAELVELQDDEIQGRVALHYFKNYVGPTIFNMCDYNEVKLRQVYLFNSSRIIIAINNFTMDGITIVMTESRIARATGCPTAHLECQVSGVRVCVHNTNACNGLPNCGAYDIYDEDRLLCGRSAGFHYTVCLAACTFLVVLLTLLYSVHYWLKRCVPQVSQAFFVYSDKSENILYLDSIMRSPTDYDGGSRMVYHSSFFDDDDLSAELMKNNNRKILNTIRRCLRFLFCKKTKHLSIDDTSMQKSPSSVYIESKRNFSFTEAELRQIGPKNNRNVSIQTGDSLEMARLKEIGKYKMSVRANKQSGKGDRDSDKKMIDLQQRERELTALRRTRGMSATLQSSSNNCSGKKIEKNVNEFSVPVEQEVELRSTLYDRRSKRPVFGRHVSERTKHDLMPEPQKRPKHLRFEERTTTIEPTVALETDDENNVHRQPIQILNANRFTNMGFDAIEEHQEVASGSGRDFRRFWGKGKKKKAQSLR